MDIAIGAEMAGALASGAGGSWRTFAAAGCGLLLAGTGLVFLVAGWRIYRVLLAAFGAVAAGIVAAWLVQGHGTLVMLGASIPAGALGGVLAARIERLGVFLLGGMAGAGLIFANAMFFMNDHTMLFSAVLCFLLAGSLAVLFWKPAIVLNMCVGGAVLFEQGVLAFLEAVRPGLSFDIVARHRLAAVMVFLGLVLAGVLVQLREEGKEKGEAG